MSNTVADYSMILVVASYLVSVLGAYTGLMLSRYILLSDGRMSYVNLAGASVILGGCAIWAMHFIGMLAYDPGVPVAYGGMMTFVSLLLPILFTMAGLYVVHRWRDNTAAWLAAGLVMGLGVATMHYTGMAAVRIAATMSYDPMLFGVSIVIAVVACTVALRIAVHWHGPIRHASSLIMGVAVCGMHYTGMAAMNLTESSTAVDYFTNAFTRPVMQVAVTVWVVSVTVAAILILIVQKERPMNEVGTSGI